MKISSIRSIAGRMPRKFLVAALLVSMLLVSSFAISKPAHAAGSDCQSAGIGIVCAQIVWNSDGTLRGVNATFINEAGCNDYDFNLWAQGGHFGDEGAFHSCSGTNTYLFAVGDQGSAYVAVYQRGAPYEVGFSPWVSPY